MKIIYMGTPEIALPVLEAVHKSSHEIVLVVAQPDRPKGRGRKLASPPVKSRALELGLPVIQPQSCQDEGLYDEIKQKSADILLVVAFRILPEALFCLTTHGAINVHSSILPKYRGAAPIQWAIAKGETETGITLFQLDCKVDHGLVLDQASTPISENETAGELAPRLMDLAAGLVLKTLDKMEEGSVTPIPQDHRLATKAPKIKKEDALIHWDLPAREVHNRIRAFNPTPVCFSRLPDLKNRTLRIYRTQVVPEESPGPGAVSISPDGFPWVGCRDNVLKLLEVQMEGKPVLPGDKFVNGIQDKAKLRFEA